MINFGRRKTQEIPKIPAITPDLVDSFEREHEISEFSEKIRNFDMTREATYAQIAYIMNGQGGNSQAEAAEKLEVLANVTSEDFRDAALEIAAQTPDTDEAKELIANLYATDEQIRITLFKTLTPDVDYPLADQELIDNALNHLLSEYQAGNDVAEQFEGLYVQAFATQLHICLANADDNVYEVEEMERFERHQAIKHAALDVAKMAGAALIAVALTRRRK